MRISFINADVLLDYLVRLGLTWSRTLWARLFEGGKRKSPLVRFDDGSVHFQPVALEQVAAFARRTTSAKKALDASRPRAALGS